MTVTGWASPDPSRNITLADADQFADELAHLGFRFYQRFVRTTTGDILLEMDVRNNPFLSRQPLNLHGHLSGPGAKEINIADFRRRLRAAARSENPTLQLQRELATALADASIPSLLLQLPGVQQTIESCLGRI